MSFEISKLDDERMTAFGWAYIAKDADGNIVIDKQGDFIEDHEELEKAAYDFMKNSRVAGEMHLREGTVAKDIGYLIESFVTTPDKIEKMGLDPHTTPIGWWLGFKVEDQDVWEKVKDGTYGSFSVHGTGRRNSV